MSHAVPPQSELPFAGSEASTGLTLHRSPAQLRLEALQRQHERLLKDIAKRKAAREVTEQAAREASRALEAKLRPLRETFVATLTELRDIFTALLGDHSRLSRRDKASVRRLFSQVLPDLAAAAHASDPSSSDDEHARAGAPFGKSSGEPSPNGAEAGYSAPKPSEKNASSLRALFRKLAVTLHPDKAQDQSEREALTSVMKEVTRAYESGDLARLVEIERDWLAASTPRACEDEIGGRLEQLLQANKELRRQLRTLTAELKELKRFVPRVDPRKRRRAVTPEALTYDMQRLVEEVRRELAQLEVFRDFAQSFLDGEMETAEFLLGPTAAVEADPFSEFLVEVFETVDGPRPATRARAGARRPSR